MSILLLLPAFKCIPLPLKPKWEMSLLSLLTAILQNIVLTKIIQLEA